MNRLCDEEAAWVRHLIEESHGYAGETDEDENGYTKHGSRNENTLIAIARALTAIAVMMQNDRK